MSFRSALFLALTLSAILPIAVAPVSAEAKPKAASDAPPAATPERRRALAFGLIEGKKNPDLRGWIRDALKPNFDVTDAEDFKVKGDGAGYAKMAKDLGADVVITGKAEKNKLTIFVYDGGDGHALGNIDFKQPIGPKLKDALAKRLSKKLYKTLGIVSAEDAARKEAQAKQVAEEEAADEEGDDNADAAASDDAAAPGAAEAENKTSSEAAPAEEAKTEAAPHGAIGTPLELQAGVRIGKRDFTFHDTLSQLVPNRPLVRPLRDYHSGTDIAPLVHAEFYPGALFKADGFASNVGFVGHYEFGIPSNTIYNPPNGAQQTLKTKTHDWFVGARAKVPLSPSSGIGFIAAYGNQRYSLTGDETNPLVPDVEYKYFKLMADAHVGFGKFGVGARLGTRLVTDTGDLENQAFWFRNVGVHTIEAGITLSFAVSPLISVLAGGDLLRYGFNFNPNPASAQIVAGGGVDQYLSGWLGAGFHLPEIPATLPSD